MTWTAVVPIKGSKERKTRLSGRLDAAQRLNLSERIFHHVLSVLKSCPEIEDIVVLSDIRPEKWEGRLWTDRLRGLNAELSDLRAGLNKRPLVIIHADLPLLRSDDVSDLLRAADEQGVAIAPDRHGRGTNAIALRDARGFDFAFGPESFRHHAAACAAAGIVRTSGLGLDIDTPEDLQLLPEPALFTGP